MPACLGDLEHPILLLYSVSSYSILYSYYSIPSRCLLAQILSTQSYDSILRACARAHTHPFSLSSPLSLHVWV